MKKFVFAFVILIINLLMVSCFQQSLDSVVERMRENLPAEIGEGRKLTDVVVNSNYLQFEVEYDENELRLDDGMIDSVFEAIRNDLKKDFFSKINDDILELFKMCIKENKGVKIIMDGLKSKKKLTLLEIDAKELEKEIGK